MTPFLLLSMARSGTQYLADLLRQHPQIEQHGEALNPIDESLADHHLMWRYWTAPDQHTYRAVGITILEEQTACRPLTLPRLLAVPDMRVIVLERINQLERIRSVHQAARRWNWNVDQPAVDNPQVRLHPGTTLRELKAATIWHDQCSQIGNPLCWVYYEHLTAKQDDTMDGIYRFLGADPYVPTTQTFQQETRPLNTTIKNWAEIVDTLAVTRYAHLTESC